jgi:hypothetical protein
LCWYGKRRPANAGWHRLQYFREHQLPFDWTVFLEDFHRYWPTDQNNIYMSISCGRVPAATQQRVSSDGGYPPVAADGVQFAITLGHASISIVYGRVADKPGLIQATHF